MRRRLLFWRALRSQWPSRQRTRQSCRVIEIRVLSPDDWAIWRQLRLAALTEAPYAFACRLEDWQGTGDTEARWRARLAIPDSHHVAATLNDQMIGMASGVSTSQDDVVKLMSMWVSPAARGRGVGDALVREIERWARSIGARIMRLNVTDDNAGASALYLHHGFKGTGELADLGPDGTRRGRVMEKDLTLQT